MYENIRPYNNSEIPAAVARIAADPLFVSIARYLFPNCDVAQFREEFLRIKTTREFQEQIMLKAIKSILAQTATSLTYSGFEQLDTNKRYVFISNHRDILLDAAILQVLLNQYGHDTSEITFGSNLMQGQLAIDVGKANKMFRIERSGSLHEFYQKLLEISQYMRYTVIDKNQSVWIAQRNGRTKDGNDKTEVALLKMFASSSTKPFADNLSELNIVPLSISYEYEPCDFLKTKELYISQYETYVKQPGEDMHSIMQGITQAKGRIQLNATPAITYEELALCEKADKKERFPMLANILDQRIYQGYQLWPTNYIAYDILNGGNRFCDHYSEEERRQFTNRMNRGLALMDGDKEELQSIFLGIYANAIKEERIMNNE